MKKNKKMTINTKFALVWAIVVPLVLLNIFLHAKVNVLEETNSKDIYPRFIKLEREDYNNKREIFKLQWPELVKKSAAMEKTFEDSLAQASKNQTTNDISKFLNFRKIQDIVHISNSIFIEFPVIMTEIPSKNVTFNEKYVVCREDGFCFSIVFNGENMEYTLLGNYSQIKK